MDLFAWFIWMIYTCGRSNTIEEAVDAGDVYEQPARALCSHLWEIEEHAKLKERLTAAHPKQRTRNHWKGTR